MVCANRRMIDLILSQGEHARDMTTIATLKTNPHLEHRIGILEAFCKKHAAVTAAFGQDAFCAMFDGALVTCRSLWALLGIMLNSRDEVTPATPTADCKTNPSNPERPVEIVVDRISKADFDATYPRTSPRYVCLVAANKCVAHLDEHPNHGATASLLVDAISVTLPELEKRIELARNPKP